MFTIALGVIWEIVCAVFRIPVFFLPPGFPPSYLGSKTAVYPYPYNDATGAAKEFHHLAADYNLATSYSAMEGFLAAKVMTEALRRAGPNVTNASLITVMENLNYDVGGFPINFAGRGRTGSEFMEMTMISKGGRFIR